MSDDKVTTDLAAILADVDAEDAVLLKSAAGERVQRVTGSRGQRAGANRSADAQAWTMGGNVD